MVHANFCCSGFIGNLINSLKVSNRVIINTTRTNPMQNKANKIRMSIKIIQTKEKQNAVLGHWFPKFLRSEFNVDHASNIHTLPEK